MEKKLLITNVRFMEQDKAVSQLAEAAKTNMGKGIYDCYIKAGYAPIEDIECEIVETKLLTDKKTK